MSRTKEASKCLKPSERYAEDEEEGRKREGGAEKGCSRGRRKAHRKEEKEEEEEEEEDNRWQVDEWEVAAKNLWKKE